MTIKPSKVREIKSVVKDIYAKILVTTEYNDDSYNENFVSQVSKDAFLILDYREFKRLHSTLLSIESIYNNWSIESLEREIANLVQTLGVYKSNNKEPFFDETIKDWLSKIDIKFDENECFVPIIGLTLDRPIKLGRITFLPLEDAKVLLNRPNEYLVESFFKSLSPNHDCIATSRIKAESLKVNELTRLEVEKMLNVLRYLGSSVWWHENPRYIYLAGRVVKQQSYSLSIDSASNLSSLPDIRLRSRVFNINQEFIDFANHFDDLNHIQNLLNANDHNELEEAFLTAVQWYGDAIQDISPLFSFVKFYTAIETAILARDDRARDTLPLRASVLVAYLDKEKQRTTKGLMEDLIRERNNIVHSGKPNLKGAEELSWLTQKIARDIIRKVRDLINKENLESKDDLKIWVNKQYHKYLQD